MIKIDQIFRVLRIFRDLAGPCLQRLQGLQERVQEHGPAPRGAGLTITAMAQARSQARSGTTTWPEALICKGGHVTVNILHDLGVVEETNIPSETRPTYTDILKKNVNLSQVNRLHRRSLARTEEVREAIIEQNKLTETAKVVLETATKEFNDYKIRAEKAQIEDNN